MKFEFSALQFGFLHLAYLSGDFPRPFYATWDKIAPKLVVSEEENTTDYPLRLTSNGMETDGGAMVSATVLDAWTALTVQRAFTITEIEAMQAALGQWRYKPAQRRWVDPLFALLEEYHAQAQAEDALTKLPQASVDAVARRMRSKPGKKVTRIEDAGEEEE